MDKAKEIITRKIGPLPLIAWVGLGAVAIFLLRRARGGGSASTPGAFGSPVGSSGGITPQTLDFQQSLLDMASALRAPQGQALGSNPAAGVSTVTPTATTASLAPVAIAAPSGGPVATVTPIVQAAPVAAAPPVAKTSTVNVPVPALGTTIYGAQPATILERPMMTEPNAAPTQTVDARTGIVYDPRFPLFDVNAINAGARR